MSDVATEQAFAEEAVNAAVVRILSSANFDASERNRNFLTYVVEQTLAGRAERIKAYNIATAVFGRDERFDPQLDSIVRIEAGRLRRSLERYYLTDGRDDRLKIEIPRGSYVPVFGFPRPDHSGETVRRAALALGNCVRGGGRPLGLSELHARLHAGADHSADPVYRPARLRGRDRPSLPCRRRPAEPTSRS